MVEAPEITTFNIWFSNANNRLSKIRKLFELGGWMENPENYDDIFTLREDHHEEIMILLYGSFPRPNQSENNG